ncbi:hypothetical protein [Streptococcus porci]|uniref:hypothetical protein n=1 Tax=Streptococcus porci TaxID=502567 RepID=UPI0003F69951|nr:hypothetical protein [Streptococcus porci]
MKKSLLTTVALLSVITLAACSSSKTETSKSSENQTTQTETTTAAKPQVDNSKYEAIVSEIKSTLDPENSGELTVEIENDVVDSEYPDGHNIIRVLLTGDSQKSAKEALDAVYSNSASTEQSNAITLLRMTISDLAKKLPDDTTVIDFGYEQSADQYDLIAKSSKTKDVIPVGDLIVE